MDARGQVSGTLTVETPEQVGIELELAGIGSRLLAALVDLACMMIFLIVSMVLAFGGMDREVTKKISENAARSEAWTNGIGAGATILLMLSVFVVFWGYYIICELLMGGASPGKRALGLRVVRDDGSPVTFSGSLVRNLVRVVDFLPWCYGVGVVAMFVSTRSQRLGDLAAGTLVVRVDAATANPTLAIAPAGQGRLTPRERALIEEFLHRRLSLDDEARHRIAHAIVAPLRARIEADGALAPAGTTDEAWLERLMALDGSPGGQDA
jgi:uncharacterized RDD family membrane protein YckC